MTAPVSATPAPIIKIASVGVAVWRALRLSDFAFHPAVVTVGSFHGGTRHTIIASWVTLELSVRYGRTEPKHAS